MADDTSHLESELHERDACIGGLRAQIAEMRQRHTAELQSVIRLLHSREQSWQTTQETLEREFTTIRGELESGRAALRSAQAYFERLEAQFAACAGPFSAPDAGVEAEGAVARPSAQTARLPEGEPKQDAASWQPQKAMAARILDLEAERRELLSRLDELAAVSAQLERECAILRRERAFADDVRKHKSEITRLEARIAELEQQQDGAAQRHSAAVAGYMLELNKRSEALHTRTVALQKIADELAVTRQALDDAMTQLLVAREEREEIDQQLRDLRAVTSRGHAAVSPELIEAPAAAQPFASEPAAAVPTKPTTVTPRGPDQAARGGMLIGPFVLVHLEEDERFRQPVHELLDRLSGSHYLSTLDEDRGDASATRILVMNLLSCVEDPLAVMAAATAGGFEEVFGYCAEGSFGFCFGPADFFARPIEPAACVARLIQHRGQIQRLLAVSDDIEMITGPLREALSRVRCSTSVAFDSRQAIDLLPMIKPDVVMVDMGLPRGEGVRLISRVRSEWHAGDPALAVLLPPAAKAVEFRQHALRAARESPLAPAQLAEIVAHLLGGSAGLEAGSSGMMQSA